jgi:AcrR family transcriptional regulator
VANEITTSNIARRRAAALGDGRPEYVERRREIVRAASEVFKARGFRGTTLGHVAERMGVDRASLYYYYSSKEELFDDLVADAVEVVTSTARAIRDSDAPAPHKLRRLIEDVMCCYERRYPVLFVLVQENLEQLAPAHARALKGYEEIVTEIIQGGLDDGSLRSRAPAWVLAHGVVGVLAWTNRWFVPAQSPLGSGEIGAAFSDLLLDGLAGCGDAAVDGEDRAGHVSARTAG